MGREAVWCCVVVGFHVVLVGHATWARPDRAAAERSAALLADGIDRERRGDLEAAARAYREVADGYARTPAAADALGRLGHLALLRTGQIDLGRDLLRETVERYPGTEPARDAAATLEFLDRHAGDAEALRLYLAASGLAEEGRSNAAVRAYETLAARHPASPLAARSRAEVERIRAAVP